MGTYLTKGTTFTTGDTVTASGLNNLVDNSTITGGSIGSTELGADSVINGKIIDSSTGSEPVTTGTIRANAISNAKLSQMANQTVKVNNATAGAADPSDLEVAANKLMAGTSNSLSALSFTTDLEMADASDVVATDNTATKIRVAASLIGGKASVTADELDEILIKSATDGALKRATVQTIVQSQVATTGTSGVSRLATDAMTQDPMGSSGEAAYEVQRINNVAKNPMLAKAVLELTTLIDGDTGGTGQTRIAAIYNFGTEKTSGTLTNAIRYYIVEYKSGDDFTASGAGSVKIKKVGGYGTGDYTFTGMEVDALTIGWGSGETVTFSGGGNFLLSRDFVITDVKIYGTLIDAAVADNEEAAVGNATGIEFDANTTSPTWSNGSRLVASPVYSVKGELDLVFSNNLDHARFMVMCTANYDTSTGVVWKNTNNFKASSKATTGFTINTGSYSGGQTQLRTPRNIQILVF